ncbi:MAG: class I SAM-dependent methyltransferase [Nitrospirae bacterium]|nr:class I SAM-dependent methyltransferase [Nitrospirota bacterium]
MGNLTSFELDRIAFIGRTYEEYMRIFSLDEALLRQGRILDCPGGASSFAAEAHMKEIRVTACDLLYGLSADHLWEKGKADTALVYQRVSEVPHLFHWDYYRDRDGLMAYRDMALALFMADYQEGCAEGRYVQARLPLLPFADRAFTLVLSSHFLFLYGDRLSPDFHVASLREMLRVCAGEVRIYPLQGLDAKPYPPMDEVLRGLEKEGIDVEMVPVPFEFQRGSKKMLRLRRRAYEKEAL